MEDCSIPIDIKPEIDILEIIENELVPGANVIEYKEEPEDKNVKAELDTCNACDYSTANVDELEQHKLAHSEPLHTCNTCAFSSKHALGFDHMKRHAQSEHSGQRCDACSYTCCLESDLAQHKLVHHSSATVYSCTQCAFVCTQHSDFLQHAETHSLYCELCPYKTFSAALLQHHTKSHKQFYGIKTAISFERYYETENECQLCMSIFEEKAELYAHVRTHIIGEPFSCHLCAFVCFHKVYLKRHVAIEHEAGMKQPLTACTYCLSTFEKLTDLHHHLNTCLKYTLVCDLCSVPCQGIYDLYNHKNMKHPTFADRKCNKCDYTTFSIPLMFKHKLQHKRYYKCELCSWKSLKYYTLRRHMCDFHQITIPLDNNTNVAKKVSATHNKYVCNICGYKTLSMLTFVSHIQFHEKPFSCKMCKFRGSQLDILVEHLNVAHTQDPATTNGNIRLSPSNNFSVNTFSKPAFKCNICNFRSISFKEVRRHMRCKCAKENFE